MMRNRPEFNGQRISVFGWQVDRLNNILGRYSAEFDTWAWLWEFDGRLAQSGEILPPQHEQQKFLEEEVLLEAQRRGLPVKTKIQMGKLSSRLASALSNLAKEPS